jgi:phosphoribosylformylglycinamidine synthase subunit PurQ / glutaminase
MTHVRALILHADGTNRDHEASQALELAGASAEIVHLNQLRTHERRWGDYQLLVLPGGFSYADALGAGKVLALDLNTYFADEVRGFVDSGKPVVGICNGFQALVKAGILAGDGDSGATLTFNAAGHFECRWVTLAARSDLCVWTRGLRELVYCPVAHGEGQFVPANPTAFPLEQVALCYTHADGSPASGGYPDNPNGSFADIAGISNLRGNVLGLMPHPEDHLFAYQHPRHARGEHGRMGLPLFQNGVQYATQL